MSSTHPELAGIAIQMAEHYFNIPVPLQRPVLDWLAANVTGLPTREQMQNMHGALKPAEDEYPRSRIYQEVAMDLVKSFVPSFGGKHIYDGSLTAKTYRACLGMIEGLSQEAILEGLIGIERLKTQPKVESQ